MTYIKTVWKNKLVDRPRTFLFQQNADGSVTLNPSEGTVTEPGTPVNAANLNNIEQGIADAQGSIAAHTADYVKHPGVATSTNTNNAYMVTLNPVPTEYVAYMGIVVTINADSTGAATLNVNNLGAKKIKKANGNDVTNLKANGVYTVRYNPAADSGTGAFILQGEGGEYGTATANDVRNTKTFGGDTGVQQGTLNLDNAIAANIKKGVNIAGVIGSSPFLPQEYIGQTWLLTKIIAPTSYAQYPAQCCYADNDNIIFFVGVSAKTIYKFDYRAGAVTDLGFPTTNQPMGIWSNDAGTILYAEDSITGKIYYYSNAVWTDTLQVAGIGDIRYSTSLSCNPDGSELYYTSGYSLKKWTKATGVVTTIYTHSYTLGNDRPRIQWVDDNSVWVYATNPNQVMLKISLATGAILITSPDCGFIGQITMARDHTSAYVGAILNDPTGSNRAVYLLRNDGTWTSWAAVGSYESLIGDRTGVVFGYMNNNYIYLYTLNTLISLGSLTPLMPLAMSTDYRRFYSQTSINSNYTYA